MCDLDGENCDGKSDNGSKATMMSDKDTGLQQGQATLDTITVINTEPSKLRKAEKKKKHLSPIVPYTLINIMKQRVLEDKTKQIKIWQVRIGKVIITLIPQSTEQGEQQIKQNTKKLDDNLCIVKDKLGVEKCHSRCQIMHITGEIANMDENKMNSTKELIELV